MDHFEEALDEVNASVDADTRERYEQLEEEFGTGSGGRDEPEVSRTFQ